MEETVISKAYSNASAALASSAPLAETMTATGTPSSPDQYPDKQQ